MAASEAGSAALGQEDGAQKVASLGKQLDLDATKPCHSRQRLPTEGARQIWREAEPIAGTSASDSLQPGAYERPYLSACGSHPRPGMVRQARGSCDYRVCTGRRQRPVSGRAPHVHSARARRVCAGPSAVACAWADQGRRLPARARERHADHRGDARGRAVRTSHTLMPVFAYRSSPDAFRRTLLHTNKARNGTDSVLRIIAASPSWSLSDVAPPDRGD